MDMSLQAPIAAANAVTVDKPKCLSRTGLIAAIVLHLAALAGLMLPSVTAPLPPPKILEFELLATPMPVALTPPRAAPAAKAIPRPAAQTATRPPDPEPLPQALAPATPTPATPIAAAPATPLSNSPSPSPRATLAEPNPTTTEPVFNVAYLRNAPPAYPILSRRLRETGRVLLQVRVDAQGLPLSISVHSSSSHARLDNAAREVVAGWRFLPARRGDTAIEANVLIPIAFNLEN